MAYVLTKASGLSSCYGNYCFVSVSELQDGVSREGGWVRGERVG